MQQTPTLIVADVRAAKVSAFALNSMHADVFDDMFSALVELPEEKGIITQKEFEDKMKVRIESTKSKKSYRDIQLDRI